MGELARSREDQADHAASLVRATYRSEPATTRFDEAPRRPVKRGSRVRHPTLGPGVVLELDGQGEDARITVFFEKAGKRKLVARFANLELL